MPTIQKSKTMSYAFGPHMPTVALGIYFGADNRIVRCPADKIPKSSGSPPAWLVADWILADSRGEPLSAYAQSFVTHRECWNGACVWLYDYLHQ